jgi:Ca2+-binding RTX toxin-like protein
MANSLELALLSLDAYNRDYGRNVFVEDLGVGRFSYIRSSNELELGMSGAKDSGFSASYYVSQNILGDEKVISYRGTNSFNDSPILGGEDIWSGWSLGGGRSAAAQSVYARQFYENITGFDPFLGLDLNNLTLTGHSLGGGLASFVSSISGTKSVLFDHMPATIAAIKSVYEREVLKDDGLFVPVSGIHTGHSTAFSVSGEVLEYIRNGSGQLFFQAFLSAFVGPVNLPILNSILSSIGISDYSGIGANITENFIPNTSLESFDSFVNPLDLHSQSLLTTLLFGKEIWSENNGDTWKLSAQHVLNKTNNEEIGKSLGLYQSLNNSPSDRFTGLATPGNQMASIIAYSAADGEFLPFGNVGIKSLYNDMDDMGELIDEFQGSWEWFDSNIDNISKIIVNFAGRMAVGKVIIDEEENPEWMPAPDLTGSPLAGVISNEIFLSGVSINNSDELWNQGRFNEDPTITDLNHIGIDNKNRERVGLDLINEKLLRDGISINDNFANTFVGFVNNYNSEDIINHIDDAFDIKLKIFDNYSFMRGIGFYGVNLAFVSERDGLSAIQLTMPGITFNGSGGDEFIIAFDDDIGSTIRGGFGTDFIVGGKGSDSLSAFHGSWIIGGMGDDVISLGETSFGINPSPSHLSSFTDGGEDYDTLIHYNLSSLIINTDVFAFENHVFSDGKAIVDGNETRFANFEEFIVYGNGDTIFNGNGRSSFKGSFGNDTFNLLIGDNADGGGSQGINHVSFKGVVGGINMQSGGFVYSNINSDVSSFVNGIDVISGTSNNDIFSSENLGLSLHNKVMFYGGSGNDFFDMFDKTIASGGSGSDTFVVNMNQTSSSVYPQIIRITDFDSDDFLAVKFGNETHYLSGNEVSSFFYTTNTGYVDSFHLYETVYGSSRLSSPDVNRWIGSYSGLHDHFTNYESEEFHPGSSWLPSFDFMEYDPVTKTGIINLKADGFGPVKIILDDINHEKFSLSYNSLPSDTDGKRYANQIMDPNDPLNSFFTSPSYFYEDGYKYKVNSLYVQSLKDQLTVPVTPHIRDVIDLNLNLPGFDNFISGNSSNEYIFGDTNSYGSSDLIEGGQGDDVMFGGAGSDIYLINYGHGHDTVYDDLGENDFVFFKGISYEDATFERSYNNDLVVHFSSDQSVKINSFFSKATPWSNGVESIIFEYEGEFSRSDIESLILSSNVTIGNDTLNGFESGSFFNNSLGNDSFFGLSGNDQYEYSIGQGSDTISDSGGFDSLFIDLLSDDVSFSFSSDMSDILIYNSDELILTIKGGIESPVVDEFYFKDDTLITYSQFLSNNFTLSLVNTDDNQFLYGSSDNDVFYVDYSGSTLYGFYGNDIINLTGSGSNNVYAGFGNDKINISGSGYNNIFAGEGDDEINIGTSGTSNILGTQTVYAGEGKDTIRVFLSTPVAVYMGGGNDFIQSSGGDDYIYGEDGNDYIISGGGFDSLYGGNGRDEVEFIFSSSISSYGVIVDMTDETVTYIGGIVKDFKDFESVRGSAYNDVLNGSSKNDSLSGWEGDDVVLGLDGIDWVSGEQGNDSLYGGNGNDGLNGGIGDDIIDGGSGYDTAYFYNKIKNDFIISTVDGALKISDISLYGDNHGVDTLIGMENLYFSDGNISVASPIIMDLNGDGVHLIDKTLSSAFFDFDNDGIADLTGWFSSGDGMLVFDENQNAQVDGINEVSFTNVEGALSDLDGLKKRFDTNDDGVFSDLDLDFSKFGVWQDINGDGIQDTGEYSTLAQLGISSIDLTASAVNQDWQMGENIVVGQGSFVRNGETFEFNDVGFIYDSSLALSMVYEEEIDRGAMLKDSFWSLPEEVTL